MADLTAAEAWAWASRMYSVEADALIYAWPKQPGDAERSVELENLSHALHERAVSLDAGKGLWKRALKKWDNPRAGRKPRARRAATVSLPECLHRTARDVMRREKDDA